MSTLVFNGIEGGEAAKRLLSLAFEEGRLPHAVILEGSGPRNAVAQALARAIVCRSPGERPCGICPACIRAAAGSHPDITVFDGDADTRAFPIDVIRKIRSDAFVKPNESPDKVFLLLGVQNMSEISQNALLKVFEEPPEHVFFILTTAGASSLLPTVRSRAQIFSMEDGRGAPAEADLREAGKIALAVLVRQEAELLFQTAGLIKDKDRLRAVLAQLLLVFRDAAVFRAGGQTCLSGLEEAAKTLSASLTRDRLLALYEEVKKTQRSLDRNANAALLVTAMCANLRRAAGR